MLTKRPDREVGCRRLPPRRVRLFGRVGDRSRHEGAPVGGGAPTRRPAGGDGYALPDLEALKATAARPRRRQWRLHGGAAEHPLPWAEMRPVYALLSLVGRWGVERVEAARPAGLGGRSHQRGANRAQ